jgi:hypothetical protein
LYYREQPAPGDDPPNTGVHDRVDIRTGGGNPLALVERVRRESGRIADLN